MLIAKRVTGEEEVPEGIVAVLTPDAPDVLSHVSVRARNMKASVCMEPFVHTKDVEGNYSALRHEGHACFCRCPACRTIM